MAVPDGTGPGVSAGGDLVEPVAIIGLAGRFPGAADVGEYWRNLLAGTVSVVDISDDLLRAAGVPEEQIADPMYVKAAPLLADADCFDARFFGFTEREAELRDPQQRIFLETAYSAMEDAAIDPASSACVGVFAGGASNLYAEQNVRRNAHAVRTYGEIGIQAGNHNDYIATLVAYKLGLTGPALTVATACSTSLLAVHLACQSLRAGECDVALAGGVQIEMPHGAGYRWVRGGIFSRSGRCRPFDASADGTIFGNGTGAVVLKLLEDARRDGDQVHAVIRGSAVNNDGNRKVGFTAGSVDGQRDAIYETLAVAGVDPRTIGYVEGHGTATEIGDPIEVRALTAAYRQFTSDRGYCLLSSVKGNVGHLGPASGIAGLIKAVLAIKAGTVPGTGGFAEPNPLIDLAGSPFEVSGQPGPWPLSGTRRAGVSSFGIGGTNVHLIVEEAPVQGQAPGQDRPQVIALAAATPTALAALAKGIAGHLDRENSALADVAHTLRRRPLRLPYRAAVTAAGGPAAIAGLLAWQDRSAQPAPPDPRVVFLLPGQGAQHVAMAREVYRHEPAYQQAFDRCLDLFGEPVAGRIRAALLDVADQCRAAADLRQTDLTQPALFAVEWALARLWAAWGVRPAAMLGHSIGELTAATLAGTFSLADAARLVVERGRLHALTEPGAMLAVPLSPEDLQPLLAGREAWISAVNGSRACVVGGTAAAIAAFRDHLASVGLRPAELDVSRAFHTRLVEPAAAGLARLLGEVTLRPPGQLWLSNVTGDWIDPDEAQTAGYWGRQLREPVRFSDGMRRLLELPDLVLIEVGPGQTMSLQARRVIADAGRRCRVIPSLPHARDARSALDTLYRAVGDAWQSGVNVTWPSFGHPAAARVVSVPGYPFERQRFWIDPDPAVPAARRAEPADAAAAGGRSGAAGRIAVPVWRAAPAAAGATASRTPGRSLLLGTGTALDEYLARLLGAHGTCTTAGPDGWGEHPVRPGYQLGEQLGELLAEPGGPREIVSTWLCAAGSTDEDVETRLNGGFRSVLSVVRQAARATPGRPLRLTLITAGAYDVSGLEQQHPATALAAPLLRVAIKEYSWLTARVIDVAPDLRDGGHPAHLARLWSEITAGPEESRADPVVALRGDRRWVPGQVTIDDLAPASDGPDGAGLDTGPAPDRRYLITGGLGALGLVAAEQLARAGRVRLALLGRRGLPPPAEWDGVLASGPPDQAHAVRVIRRLAEQGSEVRVVAADVGDSDRLSAAVDEVREAFGRIDGVVHAAGLGGGGMIAAKEDGAAEAVLRPKVYGTLNLDKILGDEPDLFVVFSSRAAISAPYGLGDYAAANAFLDSFAHWRARVRPGRTLSVNWPAWAERGMAADAAAAAGRRRRNQDRGGEGPGRSQAITLSPGDWMLDEHRLGTTPILPGAAQVDLIASAARELLGWPLEIANLTFTAPLVVTEPVELTIQFAADGDSWRVQVARTDAPGGPDVRLAAAVVRVIDEQADRTHHDLAALARRFPEPVPLPALNDGSGMMTTGARWGSIVQVRSGPDGVLARLRLPGRFSRDVDVHLVHPALLDCATAFVVPVTGGQNALPFSYRRIVLRDRLPAEVTALVRSAAVGRGLDERDVALIDAAGRELVTIEGFALRVVNPAMVRSAVRSAGQKAPSRPEVPARAEAGYLPVADGARLLSQVLAVGLGPQVIVAPEQAAEGSSQPAADTAAAVTAAAHAPGRWTGDALTERLRQLWVEILGGDAGIDDDFFDLGGDSMAAVQLIERIRDETGVDLPISAMFDYPTARTLATQLASAGAAL